MLLTPKRELEARIGNLQQSMARAGLTGAIIIQNTDLFYFTGTAQNAQLYVPVQGDPVLAVRKSFTRAREESSIKNVVPLKNPKEFAALIRSYGYEASGRFGLELDILPVNRMLDLQKVFSGIQVEDISPLIRQVRMVKSPYEVEMIRNSLRVLDLGYQAIPQLVREGMSETELFGLFESVLRRAGSSGGARMRAFNQDFVMGTISTGSSGAMRSGVDGSVGGTGLTPAYPVGGGNKPIGRDEVIYVDFAPSVNGYAGDQTRVFCIGKLPPRLEKAHQDALLINSEVLKILRPGVLAEEAYFLGIRLADEMGYKDNFLGCGENQVRFIGHGVGLDVDELPVMAPGSQIPLQVGMTFALEPKFVFPEGAIGTESTFVMTENGPENLCVTPLDIVYIK